MITSEQRAVACVDLELGIADVADFANLCRVLIKRLGSDLRKLEGVGVSSNRGDRATRILHQPDASHGA